MSQTMERANQKVLRGGVHRGLTVQVNTVVVGNLRGTLAIYSC